MSDIPQTGENTAEQPPRAGRPDVIERLRRTIEHLASFERAPASAGELRAAQWIESEMTSLGLDTRIETERAVGNYHVPLRLLSGIGAVAGVMAMRGHRLTATLIGSAAAAAVWDDVSHARRWFRRAFMPQRATYNTIGELGDDRASKTVIFVAHHDAAPSGLIFHPGVLPAIEKRFPKAIERSKTSPPLMAPIFLAPLSGALAGLLGSKWFARLAILQSAVLQGTLGDIARRPVVPGANDNLSGVAVLLELARRFARRPPTDARLVFLSTGSEESNSEGMHGWARRNLRGFSRNNTLVVVLETLGSPHLVLMEGEGMLKMREYPKDVLADFVHATRRAGVELPFDDLRFRNATDGIIALRAGYSSVLVCSATRLKVPANYHWPTDTPENIIYQTVADATDVVESAVRDLDQRQRWPYEPPPVAAEWR